MTNRYVACAVIALFLAACGSPRDSDPTLADPPQPTPFADGINAQATASAAAATAQAALVASQQARKRVTQIAAQSTVIARATDRALEVQTTEVAIAETSTALSFEATIQANAIQATDEARRFDQRATADARANEIRAAQIALSATADAVALQHQQEVASADWERNIVMPAKKLVAIALLLVVLAGLIWMGIRLFDALILRKRFLNGRISLPDVSRQANLPDRPEV